MELIHVTHVTVAICGKIEVNDSQLETFEFFEIAFKPHVRL